MSRAEDIANLESLVNSALRNSTVDGISTTFDLEAARKRLAELKAAEAEQIWPRTSTIRMDSGFDA